MNIKSLRSGSNVSLSSSPGWPRVLAFLVLVTGIVLSFRTDPGTEQ